MSNEKITQEDVDASIESIWYMNVGDSMKADDYQPPFGVGNPLRKVTICALILRNGHTIIGVNEGPVNMNSFDAELGKKLALANAKAQIWPLLGYQLRDQLSNNQFPFQESSS